MRLQYCEDGVGDQRSEACSGELPGPSLSFEEFEAVPSETIAGIATSVPGMGITLNAVQRLRRQIVAIYLAGMPQPVSGGAALVLPNAPQVAVVERRSDRPCRPVQPPGDGFLFVPMCYAVDTSTAAQAELG